MTRNPTISIDDGGIAEMFLGDQFVETERLLAAYAEMATD